MTSEAVTLDNVAIRIKQDDAALLSDDVLAFASALDDVSFERLRKRLLDAYVKPADLASFVRAVRARAKENAASKREARDSRRVADKPSIKVVPGQLPRQIEQAIAALAKDESLFQRTQELVTVVREPTYPKPVASCSGRASIGDACEECGADAGDQCHRGKRKGARMLPRAGTPVLVPISEATLTERLAIAAAWESPIDDAADVGWKPCDPPTRVVAMVHRRQEWEGVPLIKGVMESPFMRADFSICEKAGFDHASGYYLAPSIEFKRVPDVVPRERAEKALRHLWVEPFSDFPYRGMGEASPADADRSLRFEFAKLCPDAMIGVSAVLTLVARAAIDGAVPGHLIEAATQGSGKTKQIHCISIIVSGRPASVATFPMQRGRPNEEELEKVLGGYAMGGARLVAFDNVTGTYGGAALAKYGTAVDEVDVRILGATGQRRIPWSALIIASGNNVALDSDAGQRNLTSRLESEREDPRARPPSEFRHPRLFQAIRELRPSLLCAALTILRAWAQAPIEDRHRVAREVGVLGSFEEWSAVVPCAIRYAGGPNVLDARTRDEASDGEGAAHEAIMAHWPACFEKGVKPSALLHFAFADEWKVAKGDLPPDGLDDFRGAIRELCSCAANATPNPTKLGVVLRGLRGKWRAGRKIVGVKDKSTGNNVYHVEQRAT